MSTENAICLNELNKKINNKDSTQIFEKYLHQKEKLWQLKRHMLWQLISVKYKPKSYHIYFLKMKSVIKKYFTVLSVSSITL